MAKKPSKSEARLSRQAKKEAQRKQEVRQPPSLKIPDKKPRMQVSPRYEKQPLVPTVNADSLPYSWSVGHADKNGVWTWGESRDWNLSEDADIHKLLNDYSGLKWSEVRARTYNGKNKARRRLNKEQPLDSLCREAQQRFLSNDIFAQFENVFRFRHGTKKRIWGIRSSGCFYIIWFERQHKICPIS